MKALKALLDRVKALRARLPEVRKALVPLAGLVAQIVALGVLHGRAFEVATALLWLAASAGVYKAKNVPPAARPAPPAG